MPLRNGYSQATVSANIAELRKAKYPAAQAEAIAYKKAREAWRKRHPRGPWPAHLKPKTAAKKKTKRSAARKRNPGTGRSVRKATRAFEEFHGAPSKRQRRVFVPDPPEAGWLLGRVIGVVYEAERDGETHQYMHEFRRRSAPDLVVSEDGKALYFGGGNYQVTDRGIEDR